MKAIISRPELVSLIGKIQNIIPANPVNPILGNLLIEGYAGQLTLSATDLIISMRAHMETRIVEEGAITLPAHRFFSLIRELTVPEIELDISADGITHIKAGTAKFRLHGIEKDAFPTLPDLTEALHFSIPAKVLKQMLSRSAFAASRQDDRHVLNGILMKVENSNATFIGADGKRIATVYTPIELESDHSCDYVIPLKAVQELLKMIDIKEKVKISLTPEKIGIESGPVLLITTLLAEKYPDVEQMIPTESDHTITLHREELMTLLKQVSVFTMSEMHSIHFILSPGELTLTANSSEIGEGKVSMPVDYSGEPFKAAFNPFAFHDALRHSSDETVSFKITNPYNPALLTDTTTATCVLMPRHLEEQEGE